MATSLENYATLLRQTARPDEAERLEARAKGDPCEVRVSDAVWRITKRGRHVRVWLKLTVRATSAILPVWPQTPDLLAAMSGFQLVPSGMASGADVTDSPGLRGKMTQSAVTPEDRPAAVQAISSRQASR